MAKLVLACVTMAGLAGGSAFGHSYDECVLAHGSNATSEAICARHFKRSPTQREIESVRALSQVRVIVGGPPSPYVAPDLAKAMSADTIIADIVNADDDLVITKVQIVATFYSDPAATKVLPDMPLTWDIAYDPDRDDSGVRGSFDNGKAPSHFYRAHITPIEVFSHTGR